VEVINHSIKHILMSLFSQVQAGTTVGFGNYSPSVQVTLEEG